MDTTIDWMLLYIATSEWCTIDGSGFDSFGRYAILWSLMIDDRCRVLVILFIQ